MKKLVLVFLLAFGVPAYAQDHNLGFESWGDSLMDWAGSAAFDCTVPENGKTSMDQCQLHGWNSLIGHGISRTTDAHSGNYAAVVHMWYFGALSQLSLGECYADDEIHPPQKIGLPDKLYGISGYYKFIVDSVIDGDMNPAKMTTAHIMTYRATSTGSLEQVTHDSLKFDRTDEYKKFQLEVHYPDPTLVPDSVSIWFESNRHNSGAAGCANSHLLYLDDIKLLYEPLSIEDPVLRTPFMIYPNPAGEVIHLDYENEVQVQKIQLFNILGKAVKSFEKHDKMLDVNDLQPGVYLLDIKANELQVREKILIE